MSWCNVFLVGKKSGHYRPQNVVHYLLTNAIKNCNKTDHVSQNTTLSHNFVLWFYDLFRRALINFNHRFVLGFFFRCEHVLENIVLFLLDSSKKKHLASSCLIPFFSDKHVFLCLVLFHKFLFCFPLPLSPFYNFVIFS